MHRRTAQHDVAHHTVIAALIRPEIVYSCSDRSHHFLFDLVFVFSVVDPINRDDRILSKPPFASTTTVATAVP